jgi:hypothetical protein
LSGFVRFYTTFSSPNSYGVRQSILLSGSRTAPPLEHLAK